VTEARQDREALRIARDELAIRVAERTAELLLTNEALAAIRTALSSADESGAGGHLSHGCRRPLPLRQ
jgi:C4-dicarboxylate-specific signal transduction histidine kinase